MPVNATPLLPPARPLSRAAPATLLPDRSVLRVRGPEARDFLQGLVTNDMDHLGRKKERKKGRDKPCWRLP